MNCLVNSCTRAGHVCSSKLGQEENIISAKLESLDLKRELDRLSSFSKWYSACENKIIPAVIAKNGFYFLGQADHVKCFFCGITFVNWTSGTEMLDMSSPVFHSCSARESFNIPVSLEIETEEERLRKYPCLKPVHPPMQENSARLDTYSHCTGSFKASKNALAKAGFYYMEYRTHGRDCVKCWNCGGDLLDWDIRDDPWIKHAIYYPTCSFLLQQKGQTYVYEHLSQNANLPRNIIPNQQWNVGMGSSNTFSGIKSLLNKGRSMDAAGGPQRLDLLGRKKSLMMPWVQSWLRESHFSTLDSSVARTSGDGSPSRGNNYREFDNSWLFSPSTGASDTDFTDPSWTETSECDVNERTLVPNFNDDSIGTTTIVSRCDENADKKQILNDFTRNDSTDPSEYALSVHSNDTSISTTSNTQWHSLTASAFNESDYNVEETKPYEAFHSGDSMQNPPINQSNSVRLHEIESNEGPLQDHSAGARSSQQGANTSTGDHMCGSMAKIIDPIDREGTSGEHVDKGKRWMTFNTFPNRLIQTLSAFSNAGFYYTGIGNRISCFACNRIVANWGLADNPCDSRWHRTLCNRMQRQNAEQLTRPPCSTGCEEPEPPISTNSCDSNTDTLNVSRRRYLPDRGTEEPDALTLTHDSGTSLLRNRLPDRRTEESVSSTSTPASDTNLHNMNLLRSYTSDRRTGEPQSPMYADPCNTHSNLFNGHLIGSRVPDRRVEGNASTSVDFDSHMRCMMQRERHEQNTGLDSEGTHAREVFHNCNITQTFNYNNQADVSRDIKLIMISFMGAAVIAFVLNSRR